MYPPLHLYMQGGLVRVARHNLSLISDQWSRGSRRHQRLRAFAAFITSGSQQSQMYLWDLRQSEYLLPDLTLELRNLTFLELSMK